MAFGSRRGSGERTPEDRARAAAERAARRAQPAPPPETFEHTAPPPAADDPPRPAGDQPLPAPVADDPPAAAEEPFGATADDSFRVAAGPSASAAAAEDPPASSRAADDPRAAPAAPYDSARDEAALEPAGRVTAVKDRPPAPRRVPAARRRPVRRPPPPPRTRRRGSWRRRVGALLAIAAIGVALYALNATFQPFHGEGTGSVQVAIPEGADVGRIGDILATAGVVDSATFFQANATITGRRGGLRSGEYTLRRGMSNGDAIATLEQGPKVRVVPTVDITLPEGPSIRETAAIVADAPLEGRYARAARERRVLRRIRRLGAPRGTRVAEGFMFPATYTLNTGSHVRRLVRRQLDAFAENFGSVDLAFAKRRNLTRYDVLTIASLVERETQLARERRLVASVIYNRLRDGIPLGIDATIRYRIQNWSRPLRVSELEADHPYNTRLRQGLPPTPIGNPGLASIKAAARPARTDYLFFVRKPGNSGEHAFSSTDAEFQRDVERYQASREP